MKSKIIYSIAFACVFTQLSISQSTDLEDALGFTETVNDVPEAPIHLLIPIALGIGVLLGIQKLK
jgi:hypothetical protein